MNRKSGEKKPNYTMRRIGAAGAVALLAAGGAKAGDAGWNALQEHRAANTLVNPNTLQEGEYDTYVVGEGDTPSSIAQLYTDENHDYRMLSSEIAMEEHDGVLMPGQVVRIDKRLEYVQPTPTDINVGAPDQP